MENTSIQTDCDIGEFTAKLQKTGQGKHLYTTAMEFSHFEEQMHARYMGPWAFLLNLFLLKSGEWLASIMMLSHAVSSHVSVRI